MTSTRKGFTLIELLIVIAIIGILAAAILAGLGGARRSARDARRIGDLRNVQAALELYFNAYAVYPGDAAGNPGANPATWGDLTDALTGANIGVAQVPNDPTTGQNYSYGVNTNNTSYTLGASLESNNNAFTTDIDGTSNGVACDDPVYCVTL